MTAMVARDISVGLIVVQLHFPSGWWMVGEFALTMGVLATSVCADVMYAIGLKKKELAALDALNTTTGRREDFELKPTGTSDTSKHAGMDSMIEKEKSSRSSVLVEL
nr:unnamed protein product [Haemonchus contortus]